MKRAYIILVVLLTMQSCTDEPYDCHCATDEVSKNDSILTSQRTVNDLPKFLARYNQKPLSDQKDESYRLSTKQAFNKSYQVYTLTKSDTGGEILIQEFLSSKPFAADGKLANQHSLSINDSDWNNFKKVIEENCFWTLPIIDPDTAEYFDGGEWYFESFQPDKRNCAHSNYLILSRKSPSKTKQFLTIYQSFITIVDRYQIQN